MKMRRITSLTATLSFIFMLFTSTILYLVPQGRIANWANWELWGLTKDEWTEIHINFGLLFLISLLLHIYFNWKPLLSYLKNKAREFKVFTAEFNIALIIAVLFVLGTTASIPPWKWFIDLNEHFKEVAAEKYGDPPYGHAELSSFKTFTKKMTLDLNKSMELMSQAGYAVDNVESTLQAIAEQYDIAPRKIFETIQSAELTSTGSDASGNAMPTSPPPGTGNTTLADLCAKFGLHEKKVIRELKKMGVEASPELTMKNIASAHNTSPSDIYEMIREIQGQIQ